MTEYVLLMVMISFVVMAVFKRFEGVFLTDPDSLVNTYLGNFRNSFYEGNYRYFTLRK